MEKQQRDDITLKGAAECRATLGIDQPKTVTSN